MNLNLIALFSLGAFFSFLSYLVTTLEDKGINKENYKAVLLIIFLKASLGGFICLILFHGLDHFFHNMNESLRVGIAGAGGYASSALLFDASLVVPTANENRPKNIAILPLIVAK